MNPERVCYAVSRKKNRGFHAPDADLMRTDEQPYLALPLGTILNGRYLVVKGAWHWRVRYHLSGIRPDTGDQGCD